MSQTSCHLGMFACDQVTTEVTGMIQSLLTNKIHYLYQGYDADLFKTTDPCSPQGPQIQLPLCNLVEGEVTQPNPHPLAIPSSVPSSIPSSTVSNQNCTSSTPQSDCGKYTRIFMGGVDTTNGNGTRESAYRGGAYAQAWKCYTAQVLNEMDQNKKINITAFQAAAEQVSGTQQSMVAALNSKELADLCSSPEGTVGGGSLNQCVKTLASGDTQSARHQEAICYLATAQRQIEAAFAHTAYGEIEQRVRKAWLKKLPYIQSQIQAKVINPCDAWSKKQCMKGKVSSITGYQNPDCSVNKFTECYQGSGNASASVSGGYSTEMKNMIQALFPDNGQCQP